MYDATSATLVALQLLQPHMSRVGLEEVAIHGGWRRSKGGYMGKRLGVLSAAIALVALAVGAVSPAFGSSGDDDTDRTFRVVATITEVSFVDLGDEGASLGDEIVFSNKLLEGENKVGHEGAVCTTVSLKRFEAQCVATFWFRGGRITAQALVTLGSTAPV